MSVRATFALLAVLVVLGAAAVAVQGPCSAERPREQAALVPGLVPGDVAAIRATGAGADLLLTREGGAWKLGAAKEAADGDAVEALLTAIADSRVRAVVSTNAARQEAYETDAGKGVALRLEGAGGTVLAAFVVGKAGPDFASGYVRRDGSAEVVLVSRDLRLDVTRPADSWRAPKSDEKAGLPGKP